MATVQQLVSGPFDSWSHRNSVGLLILQSAGQVCSEEAVAEVAEEAGAPYLRGAPINVALAQNYFLEDTKLCSHADIQTFNFSVDIDGLTPEGVIKAFFRRYKNKNIVIYYTGHGSKEGSWHFTLYGSGNSEEVMVSALDVVKWYKEATADQSYKSLSICSQSCHSGVWCQVAESHQDIFTQVNTSATPGQASRGGSWGSEVSKYWFLKGEAKPIHSTPLQYSWQHTCNSNGIYNFTFVSHCKIKSYMNLTPVSIYFYDGDKCAASFGKPNYETGQQKWGFRSDMDEFWGDYLKFRDDGFHLKSLTCNGNRIGYFADKGFGQHQMLSRGGTDHVRKFIDEQWAKDYVITSVCPDLSTGWMVAMTKGGECDFPPLPSNGSGRFRTRSTWQEVVKEINEGYKNGLIITALSFNSKAKQYFLAMRTSSKGQESKSDDTFPKEWVSEKWKENYAITNFLKDSVRDKWHIVMTSNVCTANSWTNNRKIC